MMFTVSIDSLPLPNIPLANEGDAKILGEQTFLDESDAMKHAETLVRQGYIVRIEAPTHDDIIVCTGLIEVQRAGKPGLGALRETAELTDARRRRRTA